MSSSNRFLFVATIFAADEKMCSDAIDETGLAKYVFANLARVRYAKWCRPL